MVSDDKKLLLSRKKYGSFFWKFILLRDNNFIIQNQNCCFLIIKNMEIFCDTVSYSKASKFQLNMIYYEINDNSKYSIRSILINIPWVRKIFILMPNENVRYFKQYNCIKEKIVYIKDKDLLGYESSNQRAFQFRY